MKNGASISKKWKQAVKDGIFEGSFSEFANVYNEISSKKDTNSFAQNESEEFSSDNADTTYKTVGLVNDTTTITNEDKKPLSEQAPKETSILGMKPKTFYIVAGGTALAVAVGVYFFVTRVSSEKTKG